MSEKKTILPEAAAADGKETKIDVVAGNDKALVEQTTEDAAQEGENPLLLKLPEEPPHDGAGTGYAVLVHLRQLCHRAAA